MGRFQPTALCRELGAELRKCRQATGMSGPELGDRMGWDHSKVSRIETGNLNAHDVDVVTYLSHCGLKLGEVKDIIDLCREAEHDHGYWLTPLGQHREDSIHSLIYHEATASASISYESQVVPGLLQTENYARATIRRYESWTKEDLEYGVQARLQRRQVLHRRGAGKFTFYLHENALQQRNLTVEEMHEQLLALMLLGGLPHMTIRVVPAAHEFGGAFRLLRFAEHRPLVYISGQVTGLFLEDKEYVDQYLTLVPAIAKVALDGGQSREFLANLANEYDRGSARTDVEEEQL